MNIINQRKIRDEDIPALKRALEDQLANVTKELGRGTIQDCAGRIHWLGALFPQLLWIQHESATFSAGMSQCFHAGRACMQTNLSEQSSLFLQLRKLTSTAIHSARIRKVHAYLEVLTSFRE